MFLRGVVYSVLSAILLLTSAANAQDFKPNKRYYSIGGSINAMNYVGDLDPSSNLIAPALRYTRPNIGVTAMMRYSPRVSFRGTLNWGMLQGNDRKTQGTTGDARTRYIRGANFRSSVFELKADVVVDLIENRGKYNKRPDFVPYVFLGVAGFYHRPTAQYGNGPRVSLLDYQIEGKKIQPFQISIPFGLGFRYKLARQWDIAFEIGWRKTFTSQLDGVGAKTYTARTGNPDVDLLNDPSMVGYGSDMKVTDAINNGNMPRTFVDGNGNSVSAPAGFGNIGDKKSEGKSDWYIVTGFHLTYIPMVHVRCPKFL